MGEDKNQYRSVPYRVVRFEVTYRTRFFVMSARPPTLPESPPTNIPLATHELVIAAGGVIAEKWEKFGGWVIAGFAAVAGLSVSNYERAVQMTSARTVTVVLVMFFLAVVLHAVQKIAATMVQAGVAGGKAGKEMKLELKPREVEPFLNSVTSVYPWPMSLLIGRMFEKMLTKGVTHVSGIMIRAALLSAGLAALQLLIGLGAIGVIGFALHEPSP
jgi:hypothetical protein